MRAKASLKKAQQMSKNTEIDRGHGLVQRTVVEVFLLQWLSPPALIYTTFVFSSTDN